MNQENWLGILAGFLITFAGLLIFKTGVHDSCDRDLLERSSYIGGLQVEKPDSPTTSADDADATNPYALEICDSWPSPLARALSLLGMILIPLIGGAAAARIGHGDGAWRAAWAAGLAGVTLTVGSVGLTTGDAWLIVLVGTAAFAFLGAIGAVLADLIRRRLMTSNGSA